MRSLRARWKETAARGGMAYLLSLGLTLTLLGVTDLLRHGPLAAMVLLAVIGATACASLNRRIAVGVMCVTGFAFLLWLVLGGMSLLVEVTQALIWHLSGLTTALPLVGAAFTVVVCVLCAAAAWFVTQRSAGPYPALLLLIIAALLLWLGNMPGVLYCLLPAVLACVTLLLRAGDEETSTLRVLPLAAVVTALSLGGLILGGVTYEPLRDLAQELRQRIYDTLFYTAPRDVFTLASEGYYPQGQSQLGGPAEPHTEPVMVVITPRKTYLRGVVKDVYTGRTWEDGVGGRRYLWGSTRYEALRETAFDQLLPETGLDSRLLQPSTVTVRMLGPSASTMFVPQRVRSLTAEGNLIPYFNVSSEVFATRNLVLGDVWSVDAPLFTSVDAGLAALVSGADTVADPNWDEVCKTYLQLPDHLEAQVYALAEEAAYGAETPLETALALQIYLATNYTYTLDAAEQSPEMDFVSTFLLLNKEGYCTYFASAMTVMCRMLGLPARYVEGYVATPDGEGMAVVTGEQGHAWTEVYFRGFGWVTFDATPASAEGINLPQDSLPDQDAPQDEPSASPEPTGTPEPTATPEPTVSPTPSPSPEATQPQDEPSASPVVSPSREPSPTGEPVEAPAGRSAAPDIPWLLLVIALLTARIVLVQPAIRARRQKKEFARWLVWAQAVHDVLRLRGFTRQKNESPGAFFARVEESGAFPVSMAIMGSAENLMFYGHAEPIPEDTEQVRRLFTEAHRSLKWWQKLLFQLERIALPGRLHDFSRS